VFYSVFLVILLVTENTGWSGEGEGRGGGDDWEDTANRKYRK